MREQTIDHTTPEALANLPLERLAVLASDLISDMACIEIALTHPVWDIEQSERLHPDAYCYGTVGGVRAMRRRMDEETSRRDRAERRMLRLERELRQAMLLVALDSDAGRKWFASASRLLNEGEVQ